MRKSINILGNILYYTFNLVTMPIIIGILCYHIPDSLVLRNSVGQNSSSFIVALALFIITWCIQYRIYIVFDHPNNFGLDFFRYRNLYEDLIARKPEYNSVTKSYELYELFKYYCGDEKINIRHRCEHLDVEPPDADNLSKIDLSLYHGYDYTQIEDDGYKISLDDEPSMYLTMIKTHFSPIQPSYGFCKYFTKHMKDEITKLTNLVGEKNTTVRKNLNVNIYEHCIVMGTLVDVISNDQYTELLALHKDAEKNHNHYMLRKRQAERNTVK